MKKVHLKNLNKVSSKFKWDIPLVLISKFLMNHSTEIVTPTGLVLKSPYSLLSYYCIVKKIVHRKIREQYFYIEPLLKDLLLSIDWCKTRLKKIDRIRYLKDKEELVNYIKQLLDIFKEREPFRFQWFIRRQPVFRKYTGIIPKPVFDPRLKIRTSLLEKKRKLSREI